MDEARELFYYLPLSYKTQTEQDYIAFLWDTFQTNYASSKYQFAFLAYHMLTMSFAYFNIWQIKLANPSDFEKALIGFSKDDETKLLRATSPFTFCHVNESNIFRFMKLINCDNSKVGNYTALVKERNEAAHANGNVFFAQPGALDSKIRQVMRVVEEIQSHSRSTISQCYSKFLVDSADADEREYFDELDQIREVFIHGHYISSKDIEICTAFDISEHRANPNFLGIELLHQTLKRRYAPT